MRTAVALPLALVIAACAAAPPPAEHREHELHLPPVDAFVHVTFDGKTKDVVLADVPHDGPTAGLTAVWKAAFPGDDLAPLHLDLFGSDGFHPASRAPCSRLLTGQEATLARIDVSSHDVSFDEPVHLPGCYQVKAVVRMSASR